MALISKLSWAKLLAVVRAEGSHPPLYYGIVKVWTQLFGSGDASLRMFSVLCGGAAVLAMYYVAKSWWGHRTSVVAFAIAGSSAALLIMSREARMYSLLSLLLVLLISTFWNWFTRQTVAGFVAYATVASLALMTHITALTVIVAQCVIIMMYRRPLKRIVRDLAVVAAAPLFVFFPWFLYVASYRFAHSLGYPVWNFDINSPLHGMFEVVRDFVAFHHGTNLFFPGLIPVFLYSRVLFVVISAAALGMVLWRMINTARGALSDRQHQRTVYLMVVLVTSLSAACFIRPMPKYFLPGCIAFILLLANGIGIWWKKSAVFAALTASVVFVYTGTQLPALVRGEPLPWQSVAPYLDQNVQSSDLILVHQWPDELTLRRHARTALTIRGVLPIEIPKQYSYEMTLARYNPAQVITPENLGPWMTAVTANRTRIWFVYANDEHFFRGELIVQWFNEHGWAITEEPTLPHTPDGMVALYERAMNE
ncbi:MAG: glycosyltransferase family 39 protein [Candidatus Kerfeldbacteria bacterium]